MVSDLIKIDGIIAGPPTREQIERLQAELARLPQETGLVTKHYIADGMYCRTLWRPAGCTIVGKVHRKEHFYIVASGRVRVTTPQGVRDVEGPEVIVSPVGTKRAVYSYVDSTCITVHRTNCLRIEDIEADLVEPDEMALFDALNRPKIERIGP